MSGKFFNTLRELRTGATLDDLDSAIAEVVAAVKTIGKPGQITLVLKIRPGRNSQKYLTIDDEVITKVPKLTRSDTVFFPLADNSLTRTDPDQLKLELRSVPDSPAPVFDQKTGEVFNA